LRSPPRSLEAFSTLLAAQGATAALQYLNEGVPHRYSAVYKFEGNLLLRNVLLHDKRRLPSPEFLLDVPFEQSFCQYVLKDQAFWTTDSRSDARFEGHPYRGVVVSYHAVPLLDASEALWGTLSHFDTVSLEVPASEFQLLEQAATLLGPELAVPVAETLALSRKTEGVRHARWD
jgi:hypothetical protein